MMYQFIVWDLSPEILTIGSLSIRWYDLFFVSGFVLGNLILKRIFQWEGKLKKNLDVLTMYIVIATIVGARLGHCFFYEPNYYINHPLEIFEIWKGGLASHGAAFGILLAAFIYSQKYPDHSFLWILDRLVIVVALGGCLIRLGNLMNSEIIGKPTQVSWAFIFVHIDAIPRHPTQLYEAVTCLCIFLFLFLFYYVQRNHTPPGSLVGFFMIYVFTLRFLIEFVKENQVPYENHLILNLGQWLSIPLVLMGCLLLLHSFEMIKLKLISNLE